jgi:hypothetical protein
MDVDGLSFHARRVAIVLPVRHLMVLAASVRSESAGDHATPPWRRMAADYGQRLVISAHNMEKLKRRSSEEAHNENKTTDQRYVEPANIH